MLCWIIYNLSCNTWIPALTQYFRPLAAALFSEHVRFCRYLAITFSQKLPLIFMSRKQILYILRQPVPCWKGMWYRNCWWCLYPAEANRNACCVKPPWTWLSLEANQGQAWLALGWRTARNIQVGLGKNPVCTLGQLLLVQADWLHMLVSPFQLGEDSSCIRLPQDCPPRPTSACMPYIREVMHLLEGMLYIWWADKAKCYLKNEDQQEGKAETW